MAEHTLAPPQDPDLARWGRVEPLYAELEARSLGDGAIEPWLEDWSRLTEGVLEASSWLSIRRSQDTEDPARRDAWFDFLRNASPKIRAAEHRLKVKLLETGWSRPDMEPTLRRFRAEVELFREESLPLIAEERTAASRYGEIIGGLSTTFDGEDRTLEQLTPYLAASDRSLREDAWRTRAELLLGVRTELDALFDELYALRAQIAANAGYETYTGYRWQELGRFDYTQDDARRFHAAIREQAVPVLRRAAERRADALGVDTLRPWDVEADPFGGEALRPFARGSELADRSAAVFDQVSPELGDMVRLMRDDGLLDLDNRKGKAPGGYCATLHERRMPFIFMNAVGTEDNVRTMLHEAGHAFHVFDRRELPLVWQRGAPMEFAEVASMSMELLTSPYIDQDHGGFYGPRDALRSRAQHLGRMVRFLPYMATVSEFQHELYDRRVDTAAGRNKLWRDLYLAYNVGVDWSGLEEVLESSWQHKLHIFTVPFYYIEYGLAQMGALQVWRNSQADPEGALADYRGALALGATRTLPELFRAAGARLTFDPETVRDLLALVEATHTGYLRELEAPQAA